jgi:hypothetical protein
MKGRVNLVLIPILVLSGILNLIQLRASRGQEPVAQAPVPGAPEPASVSAEGGAQEELEALRSEVAGLRNLINDLAEISRAVETEFGDETGERSSRGTAGDPPPAPLPQEEEIMDLRQAQERISTFWSDYYFLKGLRAKLGEERFQAKVVDRVARLLSHHPGAQSILGSDFAKAFSLYDAACSERNAIIRAANGSISSDDPEYARLDQLTQQVSETAPTLVASLRRALETAGAEREYGVLLEDFAEKLTWDVHP